MSDPKNEQLRIRGRSADELLPLLRQTRPTWSEEALRKLAEAAAWMEKDAERDLNDVR